MAKDPTAHRDTSGRRTGLQRLLFSVNMIVAVGCVLSGAVLVYANQKLGTRKLVTIDAPTVTTVVANEWNLPPGDLSAKNYLVTGADNESCKIDPNSPFASAFANRAMLGERSDTIMVIRVNPLNNQAAILSFPRDMWVKIAGMTGSNRINSAFEPKNPNKLIRTIKENFGVSIDHYVSIDFCTFRDIVDAVGGVKVPFDYPTKDTRSLLNVPQAGCFEFSGEHALAYVRSRRYKYLDPVTNQWVSDGSSDYGRISRQQDFTRRMVQKALEKARTNPKIATDILNTALKNVITDSKLTPLRLLQLGQAMRNFDSATMGTYIAPGKGTMIGDKSVILPNLDEPNFKKVLLVFQGKASLKATAATQSTIAPQTTAAGAVTVPGSPTTTLPLVNPKQSRRGITPPIDPTCK